MTSAAGWLFGGAAAIALVAVPKILFRRRETPAPPEELRPLGPLPIARERRPELDPEPAAEPGAPHAKSGEVVLSGKSVCRVGIDYADRFGEEATRIVRVREIGAHRGRRGLKLRSFTGFCELRQAERTFLFTGVQNSWHPGTGEIVDDLQRHLVEAVAEAIEEIDFDLPPPEELRRQREEHAAQKAEEARIAAWKLEHGSLRTAPVFPPVRAFVEARGPGGHAQRYEVAIEKVERYGGTGMAFLASGRLVAQRSRVKSLRFTLHGFHTPALEILSVRGETDEQPISDVAAWLNGLGRRSPSKPGRR